jgi:hypothetical protein
LANDLFGAPGYPQTVAARLFGDLGPVAFGALYLLVPLWFAFSARDALRRKRAGHPVPISFATLRSLLVFSMLLLILGLFVAWNEGWVVWLFGLVAAVIAWVVGLFTG